MLPDPGKMIADVPAELHATVLDGRGRPHDAVIPHVDTGRDTPDLGFPVFTDAEAAYIPLPFDPPGDVLKIRRGREVSARRIERVERHGVFAVVTLGGEL